MKRRDFLQALGSMLGTVAVPLPALGLAIEAAPQIDTATFVWWRNSEASRIDMYFPGNDALIAKMEVLWRECARGNPPDFIRCTDEGLKQLRELSWVRN